MTERIQATAQPERHRAFRVAWILGALAVVALLIWQGLTSGGSPDPTTAHGTTAASVDIAVLV
ncbi:MAG TPA: hypothetical protein VIG47_13830, partial [Gemmatimonadaceae bacterium]